MTRDWKYPELPPAELLESLDVPQPVIDHPERTRAEWFWKRRPRFTFRDSIIFFISYVTVGACLLYQVPSTIVFLLLWLAAGIIAAFTDFLRLKRWRSEYESSIDRLLDSHHHTKPR
ncbi:MAG: hypothetical protein WB586_26365 [Chthoniobacterales bacterium]